MKIIMIVRSKVCCYECFWYVVVVGLGKECVFQRFWGFVDMEFSVEFGQSKLVDEVC